MPDEPTDKPNAETLSLKRQLGKYELTRHLASGGMGDIYLARERGLAGVSRTVVVKKLKPELATEPDQVALFIDEARIATQLAHPNIVHVYEFGVEADAYYLAMEYVDGPTLAHLCERAIRRDVDIPRQVSVHVVAEVARALDYAHNAKDPADKPLNIVHRDVSPQNVLISAHGDVKLLDFGIARSTIRLQQTQAGVLRGKFSYMSPEHIAQKPIDARSDVFSAGIVLWETTLRCRLFSGDTGMETLQMVREGHVPRPRTLDPNYPVDLEAIVMAALERDPSRRFQTAGAFASALRTVLASYPPVEKEQIGLLVKQLFPGGEYVAPTLGSSERVTEPLSEISTRPARASRFAQVDSADASPDDMLTVPGHRPGSRSQGSFPGNTAAQQEPSPSDTIRDQSGRFAPGMILGGRYEIREFFGAGAMGETYAALDLPVAQEVALKFVHPALPEEPAMLKALRNELRLTQQVTHPNLARIYSLVESDGHIFLVTQLVRGRPLAEEIDGRPMELERCVAVLDDLLAGLAAAHRCLVLHRNIKPSNVILRDGNGGAVLMDFGMARFHEVSGATRLSSHNPLRRIADADAIILGTPSNAELGGTPGYIAPEILKGKRAGIPADLYSLGVVLFEMLVGRPPFSANTPLELLIRHLREPLPDVAELRPDAPPVILEIANRLLAKDPTERYSSAEEARAALQPR